MTSQPTSLMFSEAIGAIYDCILEPHKWPQALQAVSAVLDSAFGFLLLAVPSAGTTQAMSQWGLSHERFAELQNEWGSQQSGLAYQETAPLLIPFSLDHAAQALKIQEYWNQPFFTEWARPAGFGDSANMVLVRTDHRVLTLVMVAKAEEPRITREHLALLGSLAPHLHRAITLGDYVDGLGQRISSYEMLLDSLNLAVVFMDGHGRVQHANLAARNHLQASEGLSFADGRMRVSTSDSTTRELQQAIRRVAGRSRASELESLPLMMKSGIPAVAYILPLDVPGRTKQPGSNVNVALVLQTAQNARAPVQALASLYGLTDAESRVFTHISQGNNRSQTALELNIADSTVKTHLQHIFEKTGMTSQSELTQCFTSLATPVRSAS